MKNGESHHTIHNHVKNLIPHININDVSDLYKTERANGTYRAVSCKGRVLTEIVGGKTITRLFSPTTIHYGYTALS